MLSGATMALRERCFGPRGRFMLDVYRRGRLVERLDEPNLIVGGSRAILAALLGGNVTNKSVAKIGFGTNPTDPSVGNSALTAPHLKAVDNVTYPSDGVVSFAFSLGVGEANGMAISEFGLLTGADALFARRVRAGPLNDTASVLLSGSWQIIF